MLAHSEKNMGCAQIFVMHKPLLLSTEGDGKIQFSVRHVCEYGLV